MFFLKKHFSILFVALLGVFPIFPLLHIGLPITHDGQDHVARIANFYMSLSEGNIIPRWAGNLNWGYGHPILMFLYPLPSYSASVFHFFGAPFVESLKIVFGVSYVLSGIFMYLWIKSIWGEKEGIVASLIYMYAPYRFVDMYVRGAIGEHVAFMFVPLICLFLYKLSKKYSYSYFVALCLSIAGLILSHNAITIMFLPIILAYGISLFYNKNKKIILIMLLAFILGFGLSSFFLLPAFFEGKYTLRDVVTGSFEYRDRFIQFTDLFNTSWSFGGTAFLSKQIGIIPALGVLLSLFYFIKSKKDKALISITVVSFFLSVFLMLAESDIIWQNVSILQKFQFPWRFLSVVVFTSSVLCGYVLRNIMIKQKTILVVLIAISLVLMSIPYIKVQGYQVLSESFYTDIYNSTTDTGESSPKWSVRFMEKRPIAPVEVIEGKANVSSYIRKSNYHSFIIDAESGARIKENTLYFPGWSVFINGQEVPIEFQDRAYHGIITFFAPSGRSHAEIVFKNTKLRNVANVVSLISVIALCFCFVLKIKKSK